MKKFFLLSVILFLVLGFAPLSFATNGDNLIGIGTISRSMGGVGIAAPQDAISAVFANPAAMCYGPYCPGSEFNFDGTLFAPNIKATITNFSGKIKDDADNKVYPIPAIGLSHPITEKLRFGIAAYGVSGLGVDYRNTDIDQPNFFGPQFPLAAGTFTELQVMKFSPVIAFQPSNDFSFGLGLHINYASLDLGQGRSSNYGYGFQAGAIWKAVDGLYIGATYVSKQDVKYKNVADFNFDGRKDDLELDAPQEVGLGIAVEPILGKLLLEVNSKWINWKDSDGFDEFDWDDQWTIATGVQFKPTKKLALRVGYNYAENPLDDNSPFDGTVPSRDLQGVRIPVNYYYETFRVIGFPAIVEHHVTAGFGYEFSQSFSLNVGYMYAFKETFDETGTDITGQPVTIESELREQSVEFGMTWRFPSILGWAAE